MLGSLASGTAFAALAHTASQEQREHYRQAYIASETVCRGPAVPLSCAHYAEAGARAAMFTNLSRASFIGAGVIAGALALYAVLTWQAPSPAAPAKAASGPVGSISW